MAGTLVMVGAGLAPPETVRAAIDDAAAARARGLVGPTLPAEHLCLEHVEYDARWDDRGRT